jgi:hypothetical protein
MNPSRFFTIRHYRGPVVWAYFETIPIRISHNPIDPLTTPDPRSHPSKNLASKTLDMNDLKIRQYNIVRQCQKDVLENNLHCFELTVAIDWFFFSYNLYCIK